MPAPRAILTDIEGTTTPNAFVKDVLFPFARARMQAYVRAHRHEAPVHAALTEVAAATGISIDATDALCATLMAWIDEDRKITALKLLQGLIWDDGYADGALQAPVYSDAAQQLRAWQAHGIRLYVYSSGSVHAQKLLFGHSDHGNMLSLFSGYFDTNIGNKREAASYTSIAEHVGIAAREMLFLSDVAEELDAAAAAGMRTTWLVRPQDITPSAEALRDSAHPIVHSFVAIDV